MTRSGFSLVELSIVLVILGLLTGGILSGQAMIRAADLRKLSSDSDRYRAATYSFQDQYLGLPGDLKDASSFWSSAVNGDGDGQIELANNGANTANESFQFWHQLAAAGLIEGNYTGLSGSIGYADCSLDVNCPSAKFDNAGWAMRYRDLVDGEETGWFVSTPAGNMFFVGPRTVAGSPQLRFLIAKETWRVDMKLDDGRPAYGKVLVPWANCTDAIDANDVDSEYALNSDEKCRFRMFFE